MRPWTIAYQMAGSGKEMEAIASVLHHKWKIHWRRAREIARQAVRHANGDLWNRDPLSPL
jgi:hypothetical protein